MVENKSKIGEQIQWEFRTKDNEDWFDVVSVLDGSFVEPSWIEGYQYRLKIVPEVIKPKWPETTLSDVSLMYAYRSSVHGLRDVANSAIYHALETGQVVLPSGIHDTSERDMKLASAVWDTAIKAVAAHPELYYSLNYPRILSSIVSTIK